MKGRASRGATTVSTYVFSGVRFLVLGARAPESPPWAVTLTPAERAVLALLARGMSSSDMAEVRGCGVPTIAKHVASLKRKTGCTERLALAALARHLPREETSTRRRGG